MSTNQERPTPSAEQVEEEVRKAVAEGEDIAREVERISRESMEAGLQEFSRMKTVIESIGRGVTAGASEQPNEARKAVTESFEGLQNALLHSFENARLTAEEQAAHAQDYYEKELKTRLTEMRELEKAMLDSLAQAARTGTDAGTNALSELVNHARHSGTRLGEEVNQSMRTLSKSLPAALRETALAGLGAASEVTARAADAASGVLSGVADVLRDKARPSSGEKHQDKDQDKSDDGQS